MEQHGLSVATARGARSPTRSRKRMEDKEENAGKPALMHFNEPVLYTAGSVEGFMGMKDEALHCIIFRCSHGQNQSN